VEYIYLRFNGHFSRWTEVSQYRNVSVPRIWSTAQPTCNTVRVNVRSSFRVKGKVKVKVHKLDTAPLRSESPPQKRSGIARVLKGSHNFTCTPTRSSAIGMSHTCLCLPSRSWYSFTDPGGMEGRVDIGARFEPATSRLQIRHSRPIHTATSAPG